MTKDPLLQPFQLKHLTLRNRVMSTSHEPAYSVDAKPMERYRLYHEEKAKGGIALTMIGGSSNVAPDSPAAFGNLYVGDDDIIPHFQALAAGVHRHGAAVMCQITHLGRRTFWNQAHWLPTLAPSCVREPAHRLFPKIMELSDIRRTVKAYAAGARRCKEGGLDGIEIEAYGHLLDSFWSPRTNHRDDAYGGSLDNRLRFTFEVLEEIRKAAGDDFIVGIRLTCDEDVEHGINRAEGFEIARRLAASGTLDFFNVIKGHVDSDEGMSHVIPNMGTPTAPSLEIAGAIKAEIDIPVFHAARINDVATARHAIAEGYLDMVGMTRAHMADPHIVAKIERGEEERIRPCVGMGYCIDRIYEAGEALCIHNAATGREAKLPHVITAGDGPRKKIVVVGAGPAGLEAARVSALRGHEVVVFEATSKPGGQLQIASKVSLRREVLGISEWLYAEAERAGASFRFNCYAEGETVLAEDPDIVIIATGGTPNTEFLHAGANLVTSSWDILSGQTSPARTVLFYDENGQHAGLSATLFLAENGSEVEHVTPDRMLGTQIGGTNYPIYLKRFYELGVTMTPNLRLSEVERSGNRLLAKLYNDYSRDTVEREVDQVVADYATLPADDLYFALQAGAKNQGEIDIEALIALAPQSLTTNPEGRYQLFRVGDAVSARNIHAAIYDSLRLCKVF